MKTYKALYTGDKQAQKATQVTVYPVDDNFEYCELGSEMYMDTDGIHTYDEYIDLTILCETDAPTWKTTWDAIPKNDDLLAARLAKHGILLYLDTLFLFRYTNDYDYLRQYAESHPDIEYELDYDFNCVSSSEDD